MGSGVIVCWRLILSASLRPDNNWVIGRRARYRFAIGSVQPRSGGLSIATRLALPVGRVAVSYCESDLQCKQETATRSTGIADLVAIDRPPLRGYPATYYHGGIRTTPRMC